MKALVIDDSRAMRRILRGMLVELGFDVVEAGHGLEALDRLQENGSTDIALVDWNMPQMNGLQFIQEVRKESKFDALRLMMVTTETEVENIVAALEAGADEYVMKPFTRGTIHEKIEMLGLLA